MMATNVYDIGDTVRMSAVFQASGADTDPTIITFTLNEPGAAETVYLYGTDVALVKDSVAHYHVDWPIAKTGLHWYEFTGTGAVASVEEGKFFVRESRV
jgi:hypothetical protein